MSQLAEEVEEGIDTAAVDCVVGSDVEEWYDSESLFKPTADEKKIFKDVDRVREDLMVKEYQKARSEAIIADLFEIRKPTLAVWAKKFAWLENHDDMFAQFRDVWFNCIKMYTYEAQMRPVRTFKGNLVIEDGKVKTVFKRTPFNTYLMTSLRNLAWNKIKKRNCKKMQDVDGKSVLDTVKSLEYEYHGKDGDHTTMKDWLPASQVGTVATRMATDAIIDGIAKGDDDLREVLECFVNHKNLKRLSSACRVKTGVLQLNRHDMTVLLNGGDEAARHLVEMVQTTGRYEDRKFKLLSYIIFPGRVQYDISVRDSQLTRKLNRAVAECREFLMKEC
jgi:hypothetical protein